MRRRHFLSTLALASAGLLLPPLQRRVEASYGAAPKRLIFMTTQHGVWYPNWAFNPAGLPEDSSWSVDLAGTTVEEFSPSLAPLHPFREQLTILDGLSLASGDVDPATALRHEIGEAQALSGDLVEMVAGAPLASAPTLDQLIADHIARPDRLRSIEIGIGQPPFSINYRDRVQPLPAETRPERVWDRLFGSLGGQQASPLRTEQAAVMQRVNARYAELAPRLDPDARAKLELHRELLDELDGRLAGMLVAECEAPTRPELSFDYGESFSLNVQMLRAAMACDLVRVATFSLGTLPGEVLGYPGVDVHDELAHQVYVDESAAAAMTDYTAYHAAQLAELMAALDEVPEGEGTMLDNTLIVWIGELGDGAHGMDRWPCVLAGGRAWANGRLVHLPRDLPFEAWSWDGSTLPTMGRPHQRLLNSIARAFGLEDSSGAPWEAPLREIVDAQGRRLDCSGVIDELF